KKVVVVAVVTAVADAINIFYITHNLKSAD
ncbi:hypothetical protein GASC598I20_009330, partial [Gilliamella apicola SCGC AB-598-I20]